MTSHKAYSATSNKHLGRCIDALSLPSPWLPFWATTSPPRNGAEALSNKWRHVSHDHPLSTLRRYVHADASWWYSRFDGPASPRYCRATDSKLLLASCRLCLLQHSSTWSLEVVRASSLSHRSVELLHIGCKPSLHGTELRVYTPQQIGFDCDADAPSCRNPKVAACAAHIALRVR